MKKIELLAPAKDANTGKTAILCGADAVYIGAARFSAREAAANNIETIAELTAFAHQYYGKVYAAVNTILYDKEMSDAEKMIGELYLAGVDGLIIQDVGLLELDLPPLPLIASTQMQNDTPEKVKFLEDVGFSRVILARELTLQQIRDIRKNTTIELEVFIHGALCVGASGQCYMSYALGGRSGNRGQCAQPCRNPYNLKDVNGKTIVKNRYLLSLKDLNLTNYLEELIDIGVTSFKIEGRLKDAAYVANTTAHYRKKFDEILRKKHLAKSSCGTVELNFKPSCEKTFNRGFTNYGVDGKKHKIASIDTPKSIGEFVGTVESVERNSFIIKSSAMLNNADGICFFDGSNNLNGTLITRVEGQKVFVRKTTGISVGTKIYRNYDRLFCEQLSNANAAQRKIDVFLVLKETPKGIALYGRDENGNETHFEMAADKQPAEKKEAARKTIVEQLQKFGNTIFNCAELKIDLKGDYFFPVSVLNHTRQGFVKQLIETRAANRPVKSSVLEKNSVPYPQKHLTFTGNVLNSNAKQFYIRHGVETIEPAAESGLDMKGQKVMTTKYCLRYELGLCRHNSNSAEPLYLEDERGNRFRIDFHCPTCGMDITLF